MPIVLVTEATTSTTALADSGLISFQEAKRRVARIIGGESKSGALDEAGDLIIAAIEELNFWDWDFLRKTYSLSITAGTADYTLPVDFKKAYSVRLTTNPRPLYPIRQRLYDRLTYTQSNAIPTNYTIFPSSAVEALDPQHTYRSIRFIPTPASADTVTLKYYRKVAVLSSDGDTLDLPREFQFWVVNRAKAHLAMEHGDKSEIGAYWFNLTEKMLRDMKNEDQQEPDEDVAFQSARDAVGAIDTNHPSYVLWELDQ